MKGKRPALEAVLRPLPPVDQHSCVCMHMICPKTKKGNRWISKAGDPLQEDKPCQHFSLATKSLSNYRPSNPPCSSREKARLEEAKEVGDTRSGGFRESRPLPRFYWSGRTTEGQGRVQSPEGCSPGCVLLPPHCKTNALMQWRLSPAEALPEPETISPPPS